MSYASNELRARTERLLVALAEGNELLKELDMMAESRMVEEVRALIRYSIRLHNIRTN